MDRLRQDIRVVLRGLRRTPGFAATAIMILALAIGMSAAMFTIFRAVLVRRLPVVAQDRLVVMWTYGTDPATDLATGTKHLSVVRRESRTMRDIAAVAHWPATSSPFAYGDRPVELNRGMVTGNFFDVLGAKPALGRLFHPSDDETPGSSPAVAGQARSLVLSYWAWQRKFGGDSSVIGRQLVEPLVQTRYTIVGVAQPGLEYPAEAEYWIPMWSGWQSNVSAFAVGRLAPGATVASARDEYLGIERRLAPSMPYRGAHAATFGETVLGNVRPVLSVLTAAVGLLLLIACLNIGNLLLLRASGRTREIAVRRALGASNADIARYHLVEAAALATAGGALGFGLASALLRLLVMLAPRNLPQVDSIELAGAPVVVAAVTTSVAVLLFGTAPALFATRSTVASPLRMDSRSGRETRRRRVVRQTLVVSQVGLAMVMLAGAGLLARTLERLERQDAGYVSDHVSVFWYSWNATKFDSVSKVVPLGDRLVRRIREIPGVIAATSLVAPPMLGNGVWQVRFERDGASAADQAAAPAFATELVGPEFFSTFRVPLIRGRAFRDDDSESGPLVAIVSEAVAKRLWPEQDPIGKRIHIPGATRESILGGADWRTVVGVAHETHLRTIREASPTVYLPTLQSYWQGSIAIRSGPELSALIPALRVAGHDVDPELDLWDPRTMDQVLDEPLAQPRLGTTLMSSFGFVALLLAAIGLYGVMTSLVRDQVREIGIRIALGASPGRVRRRVLGRAAVLICAGTAAGLVGALLASRLLAGLLFQVTPTDPIALGGACIVLIGVGALAAYLPARRATRIDPMEALGAD